ncbi:MAG: PilZ domain-containing protein [Candidatus Omnitrophota bacterium]|nr:MAG: PilZ domain-containing protein [Candidatus Omnitrophota bacterium]
MLRKYHHTTVKERRKHFRLKKSLTAIRCSSKYLLENNYLSRDISEDGICLLSHHGMNIGEKIKLGIYLPEFKKPVIAVGEVIRQHETNDLRFPYMLGIKFIKINPVAYHQIRNHIRYYALKE